MAEIYAPCKSYWGTAMSQPHKYILMYWDNILRAPLALLIYLPALRRLSLWYTFSFYTNFIYELLGG